MITPTPSKCCSGYSSCTAGIVFSVIALLGLAALGVWAVNRPSSRQEDPESKTDRLLEEIEKRLKLLSEHQQQMDK